MFTFYSLLGSTDGADSMESPYWDCVVIFGLTELCAVTIIPKVKFVASNT